jgi:CHAD domain-containing protein
MEHDFIMLKEIKPVLARYLRDACNLFKNSDISSDKKVHDLRVLMKKCRSALKLAGPQLDREVAEYNIRSFRDIGRIFCKQRETIVYIKILRELKKENPEIFAALVENTQITSLIKGNDNEYELTEEYRIGEDMVRKAAYRIRFIKMNEIDPHILLKELEMTYMHVADIYISCRYEMKPRQLHKFRKQAKNFLYQLYFFRPLNPQVIKSLENKLDKMTQYLGRYNDFQMLLKKIEYKYDENTSSSMNELVIKIREKQDKYLSKVWPYAYKIFCPGQNIINILGFKLLVI